ncbi:anti-sigma factor domain-containing protein [Methylobacterium sp. SD21]|uniref:anti-sigma factor n=1 Tax=Methylobacterium litchii TaxID=3138810 RepID=UPI00313B3D06
MSTPHSWPDDPDGTAGEYVLGTLPPEERAAFARALAGDAALRALVAGWETRLAPLAVATPPVAPSPATWAGIAARTGGTPGAVAGGAQIIRLERAARRWRVAAMGAGALAAGLALWIAAGPRPAPEGAQYLAVVDRGGALPALIVRVDLGGGLVQVRSLAAETPPDRSLELWYVGAGAAPRSLGLVTDASARLPVPAALRQGAEGGSLAVSVEPKGGSPTGAPTGPVIYSGKLVRD